MSNPLWIISHEALGDLAIIAIWYEKQRPFLGDRFLHEFYTVSLKTISSNPKAFIRYIKSSNIRRYTMNTFPYKIFYDSESIPLRIIAVIHASRSSRYIKRRLK